jgi:hypothetical protein
MNYDAYRRKIVRKYCTTLMMLFSFFFVINGNDAQARRPQTPKTCAGYNENSDVCTASCQLGETAICHNAQGENQPKCYCEAGNSDESLDGFIKRLKTETRAGENQISFVKDIVMKSDAYPEGEEVISVGAMCIPRPPEPMFCFVTMEDLIP